MARPLVIFTGLLTLLYSSALVTAWDYSNPDRDWTKESTECAGQRQSPIDIIDSRTVPSKAFFRQYQSRLASFDLTAINNGHTVVLNLEARKLFLTSSLFPDLHQAIQVLWHAPSEHLLNGKQFAAEMHIVYQPMDRAFWTNERPPVVVVGYLFEELDESHLSGATSEEKYAWQKIHNDTLLDEILERKETLGKIDQSVGVRFIPRVPFTTSYYVYDGSLTTPPCNETVQWWVSDTPIPVPESQLTELASLLRMEHGGEGDSRPVQPLNGRS